MLRNVLVEFILCKMKVLYVNSRVVRIQNPVELLLNNSLHPQVDPDIHKVNLGYSAQMAVASIALYPSSNVNTQIFTAVYTPLEKEQLFR